ncbi:MAG: DUF4271 domain-containing protein [Bacteroidales bacterium]|jgi:hypothetical protein
MNSGEILIKSDTVPVNKLNSHRISSDSTADFKSLLSPPQPPSHSFFMSHQLTTKEIRPVQFVKYQPDWIFILLLFCFILLAWVQVFYPRRLRQIFAAPFSKRFLSQLVRDGDLFSERAALAMGIIYFMTTSLFIYQLNELIFRHEQPKYYQGLLFFVLICILLLGFWILKVALMRLLAFIFKTGQTTREYLLNILIFNIITGIFLLPFMVISIYLKSDVFLWICTIIFSLFFFFRLARGFFIGMTLTKFSWLFLFVYLCSLEILPLIVLLKTFLKYYL